MNTDMLVLLLIFQNMSCYCQMISWMQNANSFRMSKVQSQDIAQYLLDFCQFQPGVANKSVAYRKKKRNEAYFRKASLVLRVSHNTSIQIKLFILPLKKFIKLQMQKKKKFKLSEVVFRCGCFLISSSNISKIPLFRTLVYDDFYKFN